MTIEIKPCPMCGSSASMDSTGTAECYGYDWQTLYIDCNDDAKKHCDFNIGVSADFFKIDYSSAESAIIAAWNSIQSK